MPSYAQRSSTAVRSTNPDRSSRSGGARRSAGSSGSSARSPRPAKAQSPARAGNRGMFDNIPMTVIDADNMPSFGELGLPAGLVNALTRAGITTPFAVQAATIPDALTGRDVLGRAATGAGKTFAFGLPMISRLEGSPTSPRKPHGLILVPTRELAMQVVDSLAPLAQARDLSLRLVAGGLPIQKQIQALVRGTDIVVATPGRLLDLIERRACDLSNVQVTVLDEADHMADLGFLPVVRRLLDMTPSDGQRLLFSATLDGDVATLVTEYLTDPAIKALAPAAATVDTMDHRLLRVSIGDKFPVITQIAAREGRTILFTRTKYGAERLAKNLNQAGVAASALHGGRTQAQRNKALSGFKDGTVSVLVATDVAARGIHVDDVSLVVHVDPPADSKDYLHRSGRTARAGESGMVITMVTPADERAVRSLMSGAGVSPAQLDTRPGDAALFTLTGARQPSGVPIIDRTRQARTDSRVSRPGAGRDRAFGDKRERRDKPAHERPVAGKPRGDGRPSRPGARSAGSFSTNRSSQS